jgi:replicative DNA helicase
VTRPKKPRAEEDILASPLANPTEAETTLVGWLLYKPERAAEVVGAGVRTEHFYHHVPKSIFSAIAALVERGELPGVDAVAAELYRQDVRDVSKVDLVSVYTHLPSGLDWAHYAARVREGHARRTLHYKLQSFASVAGSQHLETLRRDVYELLDADDVTLRPPHADRWDALAASLGHAYDSGAEPQVPSMLVGADRKFGHWPRGSLVIIGARTSVGKTSLATTLAVEHARAGNRVSFISVEMDRHRIGQRFVGALSGISLQDLVKHNLSESEEKRLIDALSTSLALCTDDHSRSWSAARSRIRQHARELGGVDVVFLDYVQLLDAEQQSGEKRYEALGRVSMGLKTLAMDLNCVIVALAQLNRGTEEREEPRLSDLRESGNLEQDADIVWLLWRANADTTKAGMSPVRLKVAKNRYGPTGEIKLRFRSTAMSFLELEEDE